MLFIPVALIASTSLCPSKISVSLLILWANIYYSLSLSLFVSLSLSVFLFLFFPLDLFQIIFFSINVCLTLSAFLFSCNFLYLHLFRKILSLFKLVFPNLPLFVSPCVNLYVLDASKCYSLTFCCHLPHVFSYLSLYFYLLSNSMRLLYLVWPDWAIFESSWRQIFLIKVAQLFGLICGKYHLLSKNCFFWQFLKKWATCYSNIWLRWFVSFFLRVST